MKPCSSTYWAYKITKSTTCLKILEVNSNIKKIPKSLFSEFCWTRVSRSYSIACQFRFSSQRKAVVWYTKYLKLNTFLISFVTFFFRVISTSRVQMISISIHLLVQELQLPQVSKLYNLPFMWSANNSCGKLYLIKM